MLPPFHRVGQNIDRIHHPIQDLVLGVQGGASRYQYVLIAVDPAKFELWAGRMRAAMAGLKSVLTDVIASNETTGLEAALEVDRVRAAALGVTPLAVEVAVREAAQLPGKLGVPLMREAFHPERRPLTGKGAEEGEREALSALLAGAIGTYKNPNSHRDARLSDPRAAVEIIMPANHLLRIVDSRRPG